MSSNATLGADVEEEAEAALATRRLLICLGKSTDLWRGMANMGAAADFEAAGGSEPAPMSTTCDPAVAIAYGQSSNALLFKITTSCFMNRGARAWRPTPSVVTACHMSSQCRRTELNLCEMTVR